MENTIKMIEILIVTIFIFSVYPMEKPNHYSVYISTLEEINPLLHAVKFVHRKDRYSREEITLGIIRYIKTRRYV